MNDFGLSRIDIELAHSRIEGVAHTTQILTSGFFDRECSAQIFFKCENFQKTGSFKIRGAANAIFSLPPGNLNKGVATHSSGNHAQALAYAARQAGVKAFVVMPSNSSAVKKEAVANYGAEIIECEPTIKAREDTLKKIVEETGAEFIPPFNDLRIIAGQATCAKEVFEEVNKIDFLIAPVGGGGLLSGSALTAHYFSPATKVIGAEPEGAGDAYLSVQQGKIVPLEKPDTIADGLRTHLGEKTFPIIYQLVKEIVLVSDREILHAMKLIWERMKIIVEPSGAVSLAAALKIKKQLEGKRVAIILSGGNVDLGNFFSAYGNL